MGDQADAVNLCWAAWNRAWSAGYVQESVCYHATEDFWAVAQGAIVGVAGGLAVVFIAETGGAVAAGALAAYFTAGNPIAVSAAAECGFIIGQTVAEGCLAVMGIYFLYEFVKDHVAMLYPNIICAYDLMVNQAPNFTGAVQALLVDLAARQIAEAIGVFCGLVLAALVLYVTYRITSAKQPGRPDLRELALSKINQMSKGLVEWLVPRLGLLRQRGVGPPVLRLIEGGLPSSTVSTLTAATQVAKDIMPRVVSQTTRAMLSHSIVELNATLTNAGFRLIAAEPYEQGPPGGWQLFWQKGNVVARFKTLGERGGPRANRPHLSVGFNDGRGLDWVNDLGKFNYTGKVETKVITAADRFQARDFQGNPQKFVLIPQRYVVSEVDEWAGRTHFNADPGFNLDGLEQIVAPVARVPTPPPTPSKFIPVMVQSPQDRKRQ